MTHILTPAAAISFEVLCDGGRQTSAPAHEATALLADEFGLSADSPELARLLLELRRIGVVA